PASPVSTALFRRHEPFSSSTQCCTMMMFASEAVPSASPSLIIRNRWASGETLRPTPPDRIREVSLFDRLTTLRAVKPIQAVMACRKCQIVVLIDRAIPGGIVGPGLTLLYVRRRVRVGKP